MGNYDDIIDLPHPTSERHPRMPMANRAAMFSPFAALTGYDAAVKEMARLTDAKVDLTEDEKAILDAKLQLLTPGESVAITYFQPDAKKQGGAYLTVTGAIKKFDRYAHEIMMTDGCRISIDDILEVQFDPSES